MSFADLVVKEWTTIIPSSDRLKDLLKISASLAVHNSGVRVHEMTEVSVEFVGGRIGWQ